MIDNRPGATGQIGIEAAARSAPDGHTLVVGQTGTFAVAPQTRKLPYDVIENFVPVAQFSSNSLVLFVNAGVGASSLPELIRLSRIKPGALRFGSNGEGGLPHLAMELLKIKTGIDWLHVPYKGTSQLEADLVAGHIDARSWREKVIVLPAAMDWSLTCGRTEIKLIPVVVSGKRHEPRVPSPLP